MIVEHIIHASGRLTRLTVGRVGHGTSNFHQGVTHMCSESRGAAVGGYGGRAQRCHSNVVGVSDFFMFHMHDVGKY